METSTENTETKAKGSIIDHYAGSGEAVTWTSEGTEKWSRNIPGIGGGLQATEEANKVVTLQMSDLQGNIVATASDIESETKLLSTYNSTEFGVPSEGKTPPKYAWLGASGLATQTAFASGISTQGGASYVPQVARDLQTAPVIPPGAFPNGQGTGEQYGSEIPGWYITLSNQEAAATLAEWTAKQEALIKEAQEIVQAEGTELEWIDPTDKILLSGRLTKWLARALAVGAPIVAKLAGKYGMAGTLIGEALQIVAGGARRGLNECLAAWYAGEKPSSFRCGITLDYLTAAAPPYVLFNELTFEDCYTYRRYKKTKLACTPRYSINLLVLEL